MMKIRMGLNNCIYIIFVCYHTCLRFLVRNSYNTIYYCANIAINE